MTTEIVVTVSPRSEWKECNGRLLTGYSGKYVQFSVCASEQSIRFIWQETTVLIQNIAGYAVICKCTDRKAVWEEILPRLRN